MTEQEQKKYAIPLMRSYSEAFKRKVVMEVENGLLSKDGVKYRYGIVGNSRVLDWCRKYGRLRHPKTQTRTMKTDDDPSCKPATRLDLFQHCDYRRSFSTYCDNVTPATLWMRYRFDRTNTMIISSPCGAPASHSEELPRKRRSTTTNQHEIS